MRYHKVIQTPAMIRCGGVQSAGLWVGMCVMLYSLLGAHVGQTQVKGMYEWPILILLLYCTIETAAALRSISNDRMH